MQNTKMRVLVISPQHWGTMRITKHHYAIEMAKKTHAKIILFHATHLNASEYLVPFYVLQLEHEKAQKKYLVHPLNLPLLQSNHHETP